MACRKVDISRVAFPMLISIRSTQIIPILPRDVN